MRRKQEEADEIVCSNPSVMQEYQTRLQQIASLEAQASSAQEKISLHLSTIAERKARGPAQALLPVACLVCQQPASLSFIVPCANLGCPSIAGCITCAREMRSSKLSESQHWQVPGLAPLGPL